LEWDTASIVADLDRFVASLDRVERSISPNEVLDELSRAHDAEIAIELALPLLPYQRAGVKYALETRRTLITDAMGLGKTCQGIALAVDTAMRKRKTLVVVPPHLRLQWVKEFSRFAPHLSVATVTGRKPYALPKCDVLVIGDSVVEAWSIKLENKFHTLIVDEAQSIKNEKAGRTKGVLHVARSIPQDGMVILMSGTLTPNRPSELLSPLRIIGRLDNVFGSRKQFLMRYCDYRVVNGFPNTNGAINTTELHNILRGTCMVRRRKEDVLTDLPSKRRAQVDVELSPDDIRAYRKAEDDFLLWVFQQYGREAWQRASKAEIITKMNRLRQMLGVAKVRHVVEHVRNLLSEDEQVVLFAYHREALVALRAAFMNDGVVMVAGGSSPENKQRSVEKFMNGEARVFIGQYQSAGSGLNLTCASHVVLAEMPWSPSDGQQAEDRCHRIGVVHPVVAWWITAVDLTKPTIDMRMWGLLNSKAEVASAVMDGWGESLNADAGSMTAQLLHDMMNEI
jgi:SWI/SNF-related matrix-associated actin-dependent regulator 1 of chromatin subfamily A